MNQKLAVTVAAVALLAACSEAPTTSPSAMAPDEATYAVGALDVIPGRFIVTLRDGASPAAVARENGVVPQFVYSRVLNGFAGSMSEIARSGLLRDARVARIEPDGVIRASTTQTGATWGIDRTDQVSLPLSGTWSYTNTGAGVTAYIIDTGILFGHAEFGGRAVTGYDAVTPGGTAADCNGHGTHVAGTVGGEKYGIAKGVKLVAVRVLDCAGSGAFSGVIAGMDWVAANHSGPSVANLSLGGGASVSVDDAARRLIASGVATGIAAGNGNFFGWAQDACKYSPARVAEAMTVGATTSTDAKASYSNYGNCVDFFAPGSAITSAWYTSPTATNTINGTSMATPHVVGVAALHLQSNPSHTPQQVRDALYAASSKGKVTSSKSINNHLLFSAY